MPRAMIVTFREYLHIYFIPFCKAYTLEGVSNVANFITAYEESIKPRLTFSNPQCVLCF